MIIRHVFPVLGNAQYGREATMGPQADETVDRRVTVEGHLTTDPTLADLIIDISNIVRDRRLGGSEPASLLRLSRAIQAYARFVENPAVLAYGIADRSLINDQHPLLRAPDHQRLKRWHRQGKVEVQKVADERVLELAHLTGIPVMSNDTFRDHRDVHPWIQGDTNSFVAPKRDETGRVVIELRRMGHLTSWRVSRYAERKRLTDQRLADHGRHIRRDILDRLWSCTVGDCVMFGDDTALAQPVPQLRRNAPHCPLHYVALSDRGGRPPTASVKIDRAGKAIGDFLVIEGVDVVVGRDPGPGGYSLAALTAEPVPLEVSRRHLRFTIDGQLLLVEDLSRNGTAVNTRHGHRTLRPGETFHLTLGAAIDLPGRLRLRRSGRMFPHELRAHRPSAPQTDAAQGGAATSSTGA